ncbi:hypothetical protein EUGRSUZ_K02938 [Eucalyptus grandis]|uniref:Uncharacterized protein n=2 Tax=Eucalyptus grandis TaxID=71139 RepID=A0ACC3IY30_EUCGR|nr:hypothetical protein EUGRSUZ_K02938 [Eucalyptus grandis]
MKCSSQAVTYSLLISVRFRMRIGQISTTENPFLFWSVTSIMRPRLSIQLFLSFPPFCMSPCDMCLPMRKCSESTSVMSIL